MRRTPCRVAGSVALVLAMAASAHPADAAVVTVGASKDNTLYQSTTGSLSNGAGEYFLVGRTETGSIRRGVLAFDVAAAVPPGVTVTRVDLTLSMSRTISLLQPVSLHRLLADWGEGASDAALQEGSGTAAAAGDATWLHRFFSNVFWSGPGAAGQFATTASTTVQIGGIGSYTFLSNAQMVADVQGWLNDPGSNFGWLLVGNEASLGTAKRFDSRENIQPSVRPALTIEFQDQGPSGSGHVPDGRFVPGTPLTLSHAAGGAIRLAWSASCLSEDRDYAIYAAPMTRPATFAPKLCSTGGATSATLTPAAGSELYLVVPLNGSSEGSYGFDSSGVERPPAASSCLPQSIAGCP